MSRAWIDTFKRKEEAAPCPNCVEKDSLLSQQHAMKLMLEEKICTLEAEQDDIHLCSPSSTLVRVRAALGQARKCRKEFVAELPEPLLSLSKLLLEPLPPPLPSVVAVVAAEEAHEQSQWAIRQLCSEVLPSSTLDNRSPKARDAKLRPHARAGELQQLITSRDECRERLLIEANQLLLTLEQQQLREYVAHCTHDKLPCLQGLLTLFSDPPEGDSEGETDIAVALEELDNFQQDSSEKLKALADDMERCAKTVQDALVCAATSLEADAVGGDGEVGLNELWQQTEAAAHNALCFVRRHNERCWGLESLLVKAGHELQEELEAFVGDCRQLIDIADHQEAMAKALSHPQPTTAGLQAAMERLKEAKRLNITKTAEFEVNQLEPSSPPHPEHFEDELMELRLQVQKEQLAVEAEMHSLALAAATHYPELPLLYEAAQIYDILSRDSMDGLWKKGRRLDEYEELERLTEGRHMVIVASFAGHKCALKEYTIGTQGLQALRKELLVLSRLHHPNIIAVEAVIIDMRQFRAYVQMPYYAGGTMSDWIKTGPPTPHIRSAVAQVLQGLVHMHANHAVHCDVKMENVLVVVGDAVVDLRSDPVQAILSDFDVSLDCKQRTTTTRTVGPGGFTMIYAAPEVLDGAMASYASDMWSFGCLMGMAIFPNNEIEFVDDGESLCYVPPSDAHQEKGSAIELLLRLFSPKPSDRPTAMEALLHPYFSSASAALRSRSATQTSLDALTLTGKELSSKAARLEVAQAEYVARAARVVNNLRSLGQMWQALVTRRAELDFCDLAGQHAVAEQQRHLESSHSDILDDFASLLVSARNLRQEYRTMQHQIEAHNGALEEVRLKLAGPLPDPPMYWNSLVSDTCLRFINVTELHRNRVTSWLGSVAKEIISVERVEDGPWWQKFASRRALAGRSPAIPSTLSYDEWVRELELDTDANEQLLWHAEPMHFVGAQLHTFYKGPYGMGLYFSNDPALAITTVPTSADGTCCLVLARVVLGNPLSPKLPMPGLRQPPRTPLMENGPPVGPRYDCVMGPNPGTPGQWYVIFDHHHAYPELLITFTLADKKDTSPILPTPRRDSGSGKDVAEREPSATPSPPPDGHTELPPTTSAG